MELEIRPEPSPQEHAAIVAALEELQRDGASAAYRSAWRDAGIRENTHADADAERLLRDGPAP